MSRIKLFEITPIDDVRRFQSQLRVGRAVADFIMEDDIMKCYGYGEKGFNFYPYSGEYEIVNDISEMKHQQL